MGKLIKFVTRSRSGIKIGFSVGVYVCTLSFSKMLKFRSHSTSSSRFVPAGAHLLFFASFHYFSGPTELCVCVFVYYVWNAPATRIRTQSHACGVALCPINDAENVEQCTAL